eukprot:231872-Amorphochlora_amoeboformis.AAC.1
MDFESCSILQIWRDGRLDLIQGPERIGDGLGPEASKAPDKNGESLRSAVFVVVVVVDECDCSGLKLAQQSGGCLVSEACQGPRDDGEFLCVERYPAESGLTTGCGDQLATGGLQAGEACIAACP